MKKLNMRNMSVFFLSLQKLSQLTGVFGLSVPDGAEHVLTAHFTAGVRKPSVGCWGGFREERGVMMLGKDWGKVSSKPWQCETCWVHAGCTLPGQIYVGAQWNPSGTRAFVVMEKSLPPSGFLLQTDPVMVRFNVRSASWGWGLN